MHASGRAGALPFLRKGIFEMTPKSAIRKLKQAFAAYPGACCPLDALKRYSAKTGDLCDVGIDVLKCTRRQTHAIMHGYDEIVPSEFGAGLFPASAEDEPAWAKVGEALATWKLKQVD